MPSLFIAAPDDARPTAPRSPRAEPWVETQTSIPGYVQESSPKGSHAASRELPATPTDHPAMLSQLTMPSAPEANSGPAWLKDSQFYHRVSQIQLEEDKQFSLKMQSANRWVINPNTTVVRYWDTLMIAILLFVAFVTPVEVGVIPDHHVDSGLAEKMDVLFWINRLVDLAFFLDMVLQLFLMYRVKTRFGDHLEFKHSAIICHYLKGWFLIDFVTCIGGLTFDLMGVFMDSTDLERVKVLKTLRQLRLIKLFRAVKASRIINQIEVSLKVTYQRLHLCKCMLLLAVSSHWLACLWAMTLRMVPADGPRWIDAITALEDNVEPKTKDDVWKLYLASVYFAAYTMTSLGLGDISPVNIVERSACLVMLFCAGLMWTYILGEVCNAVGSMGLHEQEFRATMDDLNFMVRDRALDWNMRIRLRKFFLCTRDMRRHARYNVLYSKMSPALQGEVAWICNHVWISKVTFLKSMVIKDMSQDRWSVPDSVSPEFPMFEAFVVDIALALQTLMYAQEEEFGQKHVLYILHRGLAGRMCRVHRSGAVWGEDFVLVNPSLQEPVESFALTYLELSTLHREKFFQAVEKHRFAVPELSFRIRRFCVRLAVQRGIMQEARRRIKGHIRRGTSRISEKRFLMFRRLRNEAWAQEHDPDSPRSEAVKSSGSAWQPSGPPSAEQIYAGLAADSQPPKQAMHALRAELAELREAQSKGRDLLEKLMTKIADRES